MSDFDNNDDGIDEALLKKLGVDDLDDDSDLDGDFEGEEDWLDIETSTLDLDELDEDIDPFGEDALTDILSEEDRSLISGAGASDVMSPTPPVSQETHYTAPPAVEMPAETGSIEEDLSVLSPPQVGTGEPPIEQPVPEQTAPRQTPAQIRLKTQYFNQLITDSLVEKKFAQHPDSINLQTYKETAVAFQKENTSDVGIAPQVKESKTVPQSSSKPSSLSEDQGAALRKELSVQDMAKRLAPEGGGIETKAPEKPLETTLDVPADQSADNINQSAPVESKAELVAAPITQTERELREAVSSDDAVKSDTKPSEPKFVASGFDSFSTVNLSSTIDSANVSQPKAQETTKDKPSPDRETKESAAPEVSPEELKKQVTQELKSEIARAKDIDVVDELRKQQAEASADYGAISLDDLGPDIEELDLDDESYLKAESKDSDPLLSADEFPDEDFKSEAGVEAEQQGALSDDETEEAENDFAAERSPFAYVEEDDIYEDEDDDGELEEEDEDDKLARRSRLHQQSESDEIRLPSKARRWTVRILLFLFPIIAISIGVYVFVWPQVMKQISPNLTFDEVNIDKVGTVEMVNPTYRAFDDDQNPYNVTAERAKRDINNPDRLELIKPQATMDLNKQDRIEVRADLGVYEQKQGYLRLEGGVRIYEKTGYELQTEKIEFDLEQGTAKADTPIKGISPRGDVLSEGLLIERNGARVLLKGKSRVILR